MNDRPGEYRIRIDERVDDKLKLFAAYTDNMYLGESGISNWDWFDHLIWDSFDLRDIRVRVDHRGKSRLSGRDLEFYLRTILEIKSEHRGKLHLTGLARWAGIPRTLNYALRARIGYLCARAKGRRSTHFLDS